MATEQEEAKAKIAQLVAEFQQLVAEGRTGDFSEADVGSKFIIRMLAALGWATNNIDEVKEQKMTLSGPADYSLSLKRKPVILYEIKGFDVKDGLEGYYTIRGRKETFAEQAMRYGWYLKVEWVVLTNFKEIRLYNTYIRKSSDALRLRLRFDEYLDRFDELWQLSRNEVIRGSLAKLEAKKERRNVDEEILEDLFKIRYTLTSNIRRNNSGLDAGALKESVHRIMNRLLVLRVSEDREIIGFDSLHRTLELWKTVGFGSSFMITLRSLFRGFDADYNTKLFEEHPCENLKVDNEVLEKIIESLYKYNFYVITSDVLGAIYEDYIGHMIREGEEGVELVENQRARRKFGIYYTPLYVVEFIIDTALTPLLRQSQKPSDMEELTVLDPACGSGSFLIKAFDAINKWYNDHYKEASSLFRGEVNIANSILANNLFGVDLDPQAAEISSVNLMLKAIHKDIKLPKILGHNIRIGNSLISGSQEELEPVLGSNWQAIRPFDWHKEFQDLLKKKLYDVIIGNPPYDVLIKSETEEGILEYLKKSHKNTFSFEGEGEKKGYWSAEYNPNLFALFIERSLELLKEGGRLGFIIQNSLFTNVYFKNIRRLILERCLVLEIVDFRYGVFDQAVVDCAIIILQKDADRRKRDSNQIRVHLNIRSISDIFDESKVIVFDQSFFNDPNNDFRFSIYLEPKFNQIVDKMDLCPERLGSYVFVNRGIGLVSPDGRKKATLFKKEKSSSKEKPVFIGKDITRYVTKWSNNYALIDDTTIAGGTRSEEVHEASEKLIFPRIRNLKYKQRIQASYDDKKIWVLDNYNILRLKSDQLGAKFLLALLNSKLINFYFRNKFVDVNIKGTFIEKLPIPDVNLKKKETCRRYQDIIDSANVILDLKRKALDYDLDFSHYLNEPIAGTTSIRPIYDSLSHKDKKASDLATIGRVKDLKVIERDEWVIFSVDWFGDDGNGVEDYEVVRMRISDTPLREFLVGYIRLDEGKFVKGNLLTQILERRIPYFHENKEKNSSAIKKQMSPYIREKAKFTELLQKIQEAELAIDNAVYDLYSMTEEERRLIEEDSIQPVEIEDPAI